MKAREKGVRLRKKKGDYLSVRKRLIGHLVQQRTTKHKRVTENWNYKPAQTFTG